MTSVTQWNPFREMQELQNRLSSLSDWRPTRNGNHAEIQWAPLVDVIETTDEFVIRADLPGMHKNDVSVTLEDGKLVITGKRLAEALPEGAEYVFNERPCGTFTRSFVMPGWADPSGINAEFKHGLLEVRVKKAEKVKAKLIAIKGD
ncbi:MAG: Hsp20/alpha crystallin family protein [Verrucomicrobia bacterium]|nr:Hsp20/alpha crystallin family protein [Verrucomicrobiota bacterium]NBU07524.1 Hsp20/alpha crystallin family protein [Pseudomonadota bacterium]NDB75022.1 Hsp20/alpha crystallin family protein [Verrucomicrobiota bacterium]NDE97153.1 Hsp20/alpha crystallin family protein [Verrucomicrobiota bacterium]